MNKNIKKIIRFYLYTVIALSATEVLCSEKNSSKIENLQKIIPLFNFKSMNTKEDYDDIASCLPRGENTHVNIQCDMCNETTGGLIPAAYKTILAHRELHFVRHQPKKNSEILDSNLLPDNSVSDEDNSEIQLSKKRKITKITDLLNPETNSSKPKPDKIQKIENETNYNSSIKYEGEYAILDFSLIDTPKKYNDIARDVFKSKKNPTIIKCSLCNSKMSGSFSNARHNMCKHLKTKHGIICSTNQLRKKLDPNAKNETNDIELSVTSIATQKQYDNYALGLNNRKTTRVKIYCSLCPSSRKGKLYNARAQILTHIEEKHLICRCGEQYESIMQIEICKKNHH